MKIIKNKRKRQQVKYELKIDHQYKVKLEKDRDNIREEYKAELNSIIKRYEEKIFRIDKNFEQELSVIREQERSRYENIVHEREQEILRLRNYINDKKDFFEAVKNREYQIADISKKVFEKFQRGLDKIAEGIQSIHFAQNDIEHYNRKQIKRDNKNILKEQ